MVYVFSFFILIQKIIGMESSALSLSQRSDNVLPKANQVVLQPFQPQSIERRHILCEWAPESKFEAIKVIYRSLLSVLPTLTDNYDQESVHPGLLGIEMMFVKYVAHHYVIPRELAMRKQSIMSSSGYNHREWIGRFFE